MRVTVHTFAYGDIIDGAAADDPDAVVKSDASRSCRVGIATVRGGVVDWQAAGPLECALASCVIRTGHVSQINNESQESLNVSQV